MKNVPAYLAERLFSAMKVKCANPTIYFCVYVQILVFVLSLFCVFPQRALVTADCFCFFKITGHENGQSLCLQNSIHALFCCTLSAALNVSGVEKRVKPPHGSTTDDRSRLLHPGAWEELLFIPAKPQSSTFLLLQGLNIVFVTLTTSWWFLISH